MLMVFESLGLFKASEIDRTVVRLRSVKPQDHELLENLELAVSGILVKKDHDLLQEGCAKSEPRLQGSLPFALSSMPFAALSSS